MTAKTNTYTVTLIGPDGYEMEVFDNPGMEFEGAQLDSWGAAIRAARVRLGKTSTWVSAKIVGPYGSQKQTVRMTAADVQADHDEYMAGIAAREAAYQAAKAEFVGPPCMVSFDDDEPGPGARPAGTADVKALAIRIDTPRPLVYTVKVHTPLTSAYMRCFHILYSDPEFPAKSGDGWLIPNMGARSVERVEVAEPEFGRGIVFHVRGDARRATKEATRMIEAARAEFSERERRLLADETRVEIEARRRDAEAGI